jgi:hypothetical protein
MKTLMQPLGGKTIDVLSKEQVMQEYNLPPTLLRRHARDMGGRGKPMRFDRGLVERFLSEYFRHELDARRTRDEQNRVDAEAMLEALDAIEGRVTSCGDVGAIRGKKRPAHLKVVRG